MGIIGSIFSGILGSNAANHAADTQAGAANNAAQLQADAANKALDFNKQQYGNSLNLLSPFYNTGVSANSRLAFLMGLNPAQGLPPGVVNPNGTSATSAGPTDNPTPPPLDPTTVTPEPQLAPGLARRLGLNNFDAMQTQNGAAGMLNPNGTTTADFNPGSLGNLSTNPVQNANGAPGTQPQTGANGQYQIQTRQPIFSGGTPSPLTPQGNQPGPLTPQGGGAAGMLNPDGSTGADFNPGQQTLGLNQNPSPNVTNATANQGGTGQVPQGGVTGPDGSVGLGDPSPFGSGGIGNLGGQGSGGSGAFGSLAQGWGQTFNSPTAVTEQNDPGYQFRLQQGQQALQNSAAARGGLLSGGTAKALTDYNQNAASGEYGNVYNRALQNYNTNYNTFTNDQTNTFNRLMALQSGGQVSANNLSASGITAAGNAANIGLTSAGQIGQNINNAGAAQASGYINSANAINGAVSSGTNSLASLLAMLGGR